MSRPKKKPGSLAQVQDLISRHGAVWSRYRAVYDADSNEVGRDTRAVRACVKAFGLDRTTVQRKVRLMKAIATADPLIKAALAASISVTNETKKQLAAAVRDGLVSPAIAAEMECMSPAAILKLLKQLRVQLNRN